MTTTLTLFAGGRKQVSLNSESLEDVRIPVYPAGLRPAKEKDVASFRVLLSAGSNRFITALFNGIESMFQNAARLADALPLDDYNFSFLEKKTTLEKQLGGFPRKETEAEDTRKKPLSRFLNDGITYTAPTMKMKFVQSCLDKDDPTMQRRQLDLMVPASLMATDVLRIYKNLDFAWCWSPKTDGVRYLFVCGQLFGAPYAFFINRAGQIYLLPELKLPVLWYDGVCLDGDLVFSHDKKDIYYVIHDCYMACGVLTTPCNYFVRVQTAQFLVKSLLFPLYHVFGKWVVKAHFMTAEVAQLITEYIPSLPWPSDGLIATQIESPASSQSRQNKGKKNQNHMGQTFTILKYKFGAEGHTIDFSPGPWDASKETVELCLLGGDSKLVPFVFEKGRKAYAQPFVNMSWQDFVNKHEIEDSDDPDVFFARSVVLECALEQKTLVWNIQNVRRDRTQPNRLKTGFSTYQNIKEALSLLHIFPANSMSEADRDRIRQFLIKHSNPLKCRTVAPIKENCGRVPMSLRYLFANTQPP